MRIKEIMISWRLYLLFCVTQQLFCLSSGKCYTGEYKKKCIKCESAWLTFSCEEGVIFVTYANYGRTAPYNQTCHYPDGLSKTNPDLHEDTNCKSEGNRIKQGCDDKENCKLRDIEPPIAVTDPCLNVYKYTEVHWICLNPFILQLSGADGILKLNESSLTSPVLVGTDGYPREFKTGGSTILELSQSTPINAHFELLDVDLPDGYCIWTDSDTVHVDDSSTGCSQKENTSFDMEYLDKSLHLVTGEGMGGTFPQNRGVLFNISFTNVRLTTTSAVTTERGYTIIESFTQHSLQIPQESSSKKEYIKYVVYITVTSVVIVLVVVCIIILFKRFKQKNQTTENEYAQYTELDDIIMARCSKHIDGDKPDGKMKSKTQAPFPRYSVPRHLEGPDDVTIVENEVYHGGSNAVENNRETYAPESPSAGSVIEDSNDVIISENDLYCHSGSDMAHIDSAGVVNSEYETEIVENDIYHTFQHHNTT